MDRQHTFLSASELRPRSGVEQRSSAIYICPPSAVNPPAFANIPISSSSPPLAKPTLFLNASYPTLPSPTAYSDMDDIIICTENPQMSEHSHSHQSRVYIGDAISPIHVPPFPTSPSVRRSSFGPLSPHYKIQSPLFMVDPNFVPVPRPVKKRRSRGVSKKKLARYKSKCRDIFYKHCSFITFDSETMQVFFHQRKLPKWR